MPTLQPPSSVLGWQVRHTQRVRTLELTSFSSAGRLDLNLIRKFLIALARLSYKRGDNVLRTMPKWRAIGR